MLPFSRIASTLESLEWDIDKEAKVERIAEFILSVDALQIVPSVRLLHGEVFAPWEPVEMRTGDATVLQALAGIAGEEELDEIRSRNDDLAIVAEEALKRKAQSPLNEGSLDAAVVYNEFRKIAMQEGERATFRKEAILRGLFLEASSLEGKYIARIALRRPRQRKSTSIMAEAVSKAFGLDHGKVKNAYCMLPDIALVAENAALSRLEEIRIRPGIPYLQMMIQKRDEGRLPAHDGDESELVIRSYGGLRVQLHSDGSRIHIFTSKLRDISPFLPGIEKEAMALGRRFIADCELLCYKGDKLSKTELVRFLNRRDGVKKASVKFELAVYDLILLDGDDLTGRPFSLRRRLSGFIHERMHTEDLRDGIFLSASMDADEYAAYDESCRIVRDPSGLYIPGRISRTDRLICGNPSS